MGILVLVLAFVVGVSVAVARVSRDCTRVIASFETRAGTVKTAVALDNIINGLDLYMETACIFPWNRRHAVRVLIMAAERKAAMLGKNVGE